MMGIKGAYLAYDILEVLPLPAMKRIRGIAILAAQRATSQAHEYRRNTRSVGLSLQRTEDFCELESHRVTVPAVAAGVPRPDSPHPSPGNASTPSSTWHVPGRCAATRPGCNRASAAHPVPCANPASGPKPPERPRRRSESRG